MYVAPTPFGLLDGVAHHQTLILPNNVAVPDGFKEVGSIIRKEVGQLVIKYSFDLQNNKLGAEHIPNPHAGCKHIFHALRLSDGLNTPVTLRSDTVKGNSENGEGN